MKNIFKRKKPICEPQDNGKENEFDAWKALISFVPVKVLGIISLFSVPVLVISYISQGFSEIYTRTVGNFLRNVTAKISSIFPFSITELFIVFSLAFVIYALYKAIREAILKVPYEKRFDVIFNRVVACFLLFSFSLYNLTFATCAGRYPLEKNMGLERASLSHESLVELGKTVAEELNLTVSEMNFRATPEGSSCMPYSYDELNRKLNKLYSEYSKENKFVAGFSSRVKRVALSAFMTYTHISGVYVPFTGEVNVNVNYPHYVTAFTYAHEMAHQRGIAREDEANFVAFCVMYESDDSYLKYSALLQLFDYVINAVYEQSPEDFTALLASCDTRILREEIAYANFFDQYRDSAASDVFGAVNDVSIKIRGDSDGEKSYDMMIELAASYFDAQK